MPLHVARYKKWKEGIILMLILVRFHNKMPCGLGAWSIDICKLIRNSEIVKIFHGEQGVSQDDLNERSIMS